MLLTESDIRYIVSSVLSEMAYPASFSLNIFKSLPSFKAREQYCNLHLQRLASGSSRIVYKIDDNKVLKLAKNKKGLAQNEYESNNYYLYQIGIGAQIFDCDENNQWIEMELCQKCKPSDFKRICGYDFNFICEFINYIHCWYSRNKYASYNKSFETEFKKITMDPDNYNDIFSGLIDYLTNYGLETIGDLQRISSWGIANRNGKTLLLLVDYGISDDIYQQYYRR